MFKDGIDFDALIEAKPFNRPKIVYKYAMSDGGLVMVDVVRVDNSPIELFMVPLGLSFKEKIFATHQSRKELSC